MHPLKNCRICLIGLGYVGLPLAVEFGKTYPTLGFDIDNERILELRQGQDRTLEVDKNELKGSQHLTFTSDLSEIRDANVYIVTVPTPINEFKTPDLGPLIAASKTVASVISPGDTVIFESTVYPGATEEVCVPIIEEISGLAYNKDFYAGYSPERINPGDKEHRVTNILKVTSGSTPEAADFVDALYQSIITAGTHKTSSIKVAEAAKVIENTQRDVNIALINELSLLFGKLGIDTLEVLEAAGTKWNFLPFRPGLVGGHCIGVDPYYLTHKAQSIGHHPEVILSGRRINDAMGEIVAKNVIKMMTQRKIHVTDSNVLIMGLTFKENCPDIRNTRVTDVIRIFKSYGANIDVFDPWASPAETKQEYGIELTPSPKEGHYDAIVLTVGHSQFNDLGAEGIRKFGKENHILFDVKYILPKEAVDGRL
ncbi:Vi polysaccharide biosynthesis protein VipA/TviB [Hahella sp. CCB-MM4]|uniref:Vi polysaccharide biosynthesis UDP-N-acetylglucosamine C-6 dehydrogenase TviB n=1 Tax=Hahella sp. (strain CCB-MM4) TaxID=1926491 RepID=UPI000B9BFB3E|nr:Vi polysaccharide biosynthesis UDP-N-acetylglucosamine C-6 dehydrogenase TviB [Hahella sp. CCB-MM4]OZG73445.1 Vi polysaccharide biosynthesis protein VipA/TviB [Hahella sp. CCB-MM4]